MSYNAPSDHTTGLGVEARVVDANLTFQSPPTNTLTLSVGGVNAPHTYQTECEVQDASGNTQGSFSFTLTAVAAYDPAAGTSTYTGTITGGAANAFAGLVFTIAGFTKSANNGVFVCVGSSTTTLVLLNLNALAETHGATAKSGAFNSLVYLSREPAVATVSADGLITGVAVGNAVIEVSYPFANNSLGTAPDGSYQEKVWLEINVKVLL